MDISPLLSTYLITIVSGKLVGYSKPYVDGFGSRKLIKIMMKSEECGIFVKPFSTMGLSEL
jgi:hypothetical protein